MAGPDDAFLVALAARIATRLTPPGLRMACAESCTGGWIAKICTDLPGSSGWFAGGIVAYSNALKQRLLGVPVQDLERHGAVSESVVRAMAAGLLEATGADVGVAVSGIAGPDGGSADKPVGTVWFAWASRVPGAAPNVAAARAAYAGDRETVRRLAVARALEGLLDR